VAVAGWQSREVSWGRIGVSGVGSKGGRVAATAVICKMDNTSWMQQARIRAPKEERYESSRKDIENSVFAVREKRGEGPGW